jgi:uncharacterized protein YndB with AHSA1/START domain
MRELSDSVHIAVPPALVWEWLIGLAEHYTEWHPDHRSAEWIEGDPYHVSSVLRAEEELAGKREVLAFEVTSLDPPNRFGYRVRGAHGLVLRGGSFAVAPHDGGSLFTATLSFRGGKLTERLFRHRIEALERHMSEEGQNLKRLLESATEPM